MVAAIFVCKYFNLAKFLRLHGMNLAYILKFFSSQWWQIFLMIELGKPRRGIKNLLIALNHFETAVLRNMVGTPSSLRNLPQKAPCEMFFFVARDESHIHISHARLDWLAPLTHSITKVYMSKHEPRSISALKVLD